MSLAGDRAGGTGASGTGPNGAGEPTAERGRILSIVSSVDHKVIGLAYILTALFFFVIGGAEALLLRIQLAFPGNDFLSPDAYNQLFTMHGTTMVFLVGMPVLVGFANYFVPLMIGARDMAFPRLNALGYWMLPLGGFLLHYSFLTGRGPDVGWFAYAPLSSRPYASLEGVDYWILGLLVMGVGSVATSINIAVTVIKYRAPGMSMQRLPLFVWMVFITAILTIMAIPALNAALVMLLSDRLLESAFFQPQRGGSAVLWQHFFWVFGHPEVYILVLPAFGMISEVIPVFSRKPIYGYAIVAGSTVVIAILGFGVWAHHMFAVGMGMGPDLFFAIGSMLIAIPTGIKVFNWIATMWGGSVHFTVSMKFAIGFLVLFVLGGLSGVMFAVAPIDWQTTDTYFVVAHFHYVLFGGTVFALFAATYYWFPKMSGRMLSERIGSWNFWLVLIGFNATFLVQHFLGVMGMPRRVYTYADEPGWALLNGISTAGAFLIAFGVLAFALNLVLSLKRGKLAGDNPWGAFTLEWLTTSPPPAENFERVPMIRDRRPVWGLDHPEQADWRVHKSPEDDRRPHSKAKLAVGFFLQSETVFFILMLTAFVVYNSKAMEGPTSSTALDPARTGLFTVCLLASSATIWMAERSLRRGSRRAFHSFLGLTIALGVVFLGGQALEYSGLLGDQVTMSRNLFAATFFAVTGFHGLHVFGGLVALGILFFMTRGGAGKSPEKQADSVAAIAMYWHFVDVVWIAVFAIIYLGVLS